MKLMVILGKNYTRSITQMHVNLLFIFILSCTIIMVSLTVLHYRDTIVVRKPPWSLDDTLYLLEKLASSCELALYYCLFTDTGLQSSNLR